MQTFQVTVKIDVEAATHAQALVLVTEAVDGRNRQLLDARQAQRLALTEVLNSKIVGRK